MDLVIRPSGAAQAIYDEAIDLAVLGTLSITRASRVEPDADGRWIADLAAVGGPLLGPFARRSEALQAEVAWLRTYLLDGSATANGSASF